MRERDRVIQSLEGAFREAFRAAQERDDKGGMAKLDLDFQRDQIHLEVLLDIRDLLSVPTQEGKVSSLLEKAQALRQLTRLR
ncbi:MAG TPA: hypothetical protein VLH75_05110 [Longimicrobiales bacterium]|nr:hypothetical protein [Longimicrobiales bacterium]